MNLFGFGDPQCQLMVAFENNDSELFEVALDCGAKADLQVHGQLSIFEKVLSTPGCGNLIKICVEHNCQVNPELNRSALSYAAESRHYENLAALLGKKGLNCIRRINCHLDVTYDHLTPLNSLAKNLTEENALEVKRCIGYLLECGASPNIPDQNGHPPLYHVLNTTFANIDIKMDLVKLFLHNNFLDIENYCNGEMCRMIKAQFPMLLLPTYDTLSRPYSILLEEESPSITDMERLQVTLKGGDENMFKDQFAEFIRNCKPIQIGGMKISTIPIDDVTDILRFSIKDHRNKVVQANLNIFQWLDETSESDLNHTAINSLNVHAMKILMKSCSKTSLKIGLHKYLKAIGAAATNQFEKMSFVDVILNRYIWAINDVDEYGRTPLNYMKGNPRIMLSLLNHGAFIGSDIKHIPLDVLEEHLDSCIYSYTSEEHSSKIYMDLSSLKANDDKTVILGDEMAPIAYIAESKEMHPLLEHPVILAFFSVKWEEMGFFIIPDLIINFIIYISIACYILLKCFHNHNINGGCSRNSSEQVGSGLSLELNGSRYGLEPNGSGYSLELEGSCYSLEPNESVYSLQLNGSEYLMCNSVHFAQIQSSSISVTPLYMLLVHVAMIAYLAVREFIQFIILKKRYLKKKNLLDVTFVILSFLTCIIDINSQSGRALACFTILLTFLELCSLLCCLPIYFIATHMLMFREVMFSFINALSFYSIFLLVFYVSFIILFNIGNPFANAVVDFVKIFAMMTGEINFLEYKITDDLTALFFLSFIILIAIVLMNLTYGLIIHDIQVMKKQANLDEIIFRINLLYQYDRVFRSIHRMLTWRCVPGSISKFIRQRMEDACLADKIFIRQKNKFDIFRVNNSKNWFLSRTWKMDNYIVEMSYAILDKRKSPSNEKIRFRKYLQRRNYNNKIIFRDYEDYYSDDIFTKKPIKKSLGLPCFDHFNMFLAEIKKIGIKLHEKIRYRTSQEQKKRKQEKEKKRN